MSGLPSELSINHYHRQKQWRICKYLKFKWAVLSYSIQELIDILSRIKYITDRSIMKGAYSWFHQRFRNHITCKCVRLSVSVSGKEIIHVSPFRTIPRIDKMYSNTIYFHFFQFLSLPSAGTKFGWCFWWMDRIPSRDISFFSRVPVAKLIIFDWKNKTYMCIVIDVSLLCK